MKQCAQWLWCKQMWSYFDFSVWLFNRKNHLIMKMRDIFIHILLCNLLMIYIWFIQLHTFHTFHMNFHIYFSKFFDIQTFTHTHHTKNNFRKSRFCQNIAFYFWKCQWSKITTRHRFENFKKTNLLFDENYLICDMKFLICFKNFR